MAHKDWYVEGPAFGNCNCGYSCPCQFEEDPTHGDCRGFEVMEITKGLILLKNSCLIEA